MVGQLLPLAKAFITITPDSQRALQAQALADYLRGEGAEAHSCETVQQGMEKALSMGRTGGRGVRVRLPVHDRRGPPRAGPVLTD